MQKMLLAALISLVLLGLLPRPCLSQPSPHLWIVEDIRYPNGAVVPAANLSFAASLHKTSGVPVPEVLTQTTDGCGVSDVAGFRLWVECSMFGDDTTPDQWWVAGDTLVTKIYAANDPVTGLIDSTEVRDVQLGGSQNNPQYYAGVFVPIELMAFSAQRQGNDVVLSWTVARELENLGFYIQRSGSAEGVFTRISGLIPGRGDAEQEATYSWVDASPQGPVAFYMLEDVDFQGHSTTHGPVRVVVGDNASWGAIKAAFAE